MPNVLPCRHMDVLIAEMQVVIGAAGATIVSVIGTGLALTVMAHRITSHLDKRIDRAEDADSTFRAEMLRLAERQSHLEGRLEERTGAD